MAKPLSTAGLSSKPSWQTVVDEGRIDLKTLDFREMASFSRDFSEAERIHEAQMAMWASENVQACWCTLRHAATVSRSYSPGHAEAFQHRLDPLVNDDSGWCVGVVDDPLDVNDPSNLYLSSLYGLSIHDMRLAASWLLPVGYRVLFSGEKLSVESS